MGEINGEWGTSIADPIVTSVLLYLSLTVGYPGIAAKRTLGLNRMLDTLFNCP
jgi:hypothetical protein